MLVVENALLPKKLDNWFIQNMSKDKRQWTKANPVLIIIGRSRPDECPVSFAGVACWPAIGRPDLFTAGVKSSSADRRKCVYEPRVITRQAASCLFVCAIVIVSTN